MEEQRSIERNNRDVNSVQPDGSVRSEKYGDVEHQAKRAKVDGMRSVIDKNKVETKMNEITVMRQLEEVYVRSMGKEAYEEQLVHLANQMPGMRATKTGGAGEELHTPRSVGGENISRSGGGGETSIARSGGSTSILDGEDE